MRTVRVPSSLKGYFSGNDLSGWMDGIAYTSPERKQRKGKKKRKVKLIAPAIPLEPKRVALGKDASVKGFLRSKK